MSDIDDIITMPNHVMLENVAGHCSMSCNMCPIDSYPRKETMSDELFFRIVSRLAPYKSNISYFSLVGLGESLLDKSVHTKVSYLKSDGWRGVGVYTNGTPLTERTSENLLKSGLDSLLISIDGFSSKVQNTIRKGGDLKKIRSNLLRFIELRNTGSYQTKVVIRFTEQDLNVDEYESFYNFWSSVINVNSGDMILKYELHNHGVLVDTSALTKFSTRKNSLSAAKPTRCKEIFERLTILSDGSVGLCCGDHLFKEQTGSILDRDPIDIYNSGSHKRYRRAFLTEDFSEAPLCNGCTVMSSILSKQIGI